MNTLLKMQTHPTELPAISPLRSSSGYNYHFLNTYFQYIIVIFFCFRKYTKFISNRKIKFTFFYEIVTRTLLNHFRFPCFAMVRPPATVKQMPVNYRSGKQKAG